MSYRKIESAVTKETPEELEPQDLDEIAAGWGRASGYSRSDGRSASFTKRSSWASQAGGATPSTGAFKSVEGLSSRDQ